MGAEAELEGVVAVRDDVVEKSLWASCFDGQVDRRWKGVDACMHAQDPEERVKVEPRWYCYWKIEIARSSSV